MKMYIIKQASERELAIATANNGKINKGHAFELAYTMHATRNAIASNYRVDNNSYKTSCDIEDKELKTARAQVGAIKDGETLEQFAKRRTAEGKADLFCIGFDGVIENRYIILELNRAEMADFIIRYGKIDKAASSKGGGRVVRLEGMRGLKAQRNILERYGF